MDEPKPRLREADREIELEVPRVLDDLLPEDHLARVIWDALGSIDLTDFYVPIQARGAAPGRPATDPRLLLCLWLFATCEGVISGRRLAKLCREHRAYIWILGGVTLDYKVLNDFRRLHAAEFERLHTELLAAFLKKGLVELERVAQDGIRVRASAGAASFRRQQTLELCLEEAKEQLESVLRNRKEKPTHRTRRQQAAQERAARERKARVEAALEELPKIREAKKSEEKRKQARASTTDPEARPMKMADGGFRPAYNVQLGVDTESRVVVGVQVSNSGGDMGKIPGMLADIEERTDRLPEEHLVDGGYVKHADIEAAAARGVTVYAPLPKPKQPDDAPSGPGTPDEAQTDRDPDASRRKSKPRDGPGLAAWRQRMATEGAKAIYKDRAATVETVNGDLRAHRGWQQIPLRGHEGARAFVFLGVLAYNLLQAIRLGLFGGRQA